MLHNVQMRFSLGSLVNLPVSTRRGNHPYLTCDNNDFSYLHVSIFNCKYISTPKLSLILLGAFINYRQGGILISGKVSAGILRPPPIGGDLDSMTPPVGGGLDSTTPYRKGFETKI